MADRIRAPPRFFDCAIERSSQLSAASSPLGLRKCLPRRTVRDPESTREDSLRCSNSSRAASTCRCDSARKRPGKSGPGPRRRPQP